MSEINNENELMHWGIKGMRWGIRRTPEQLGKQSAKKKAELEKDKFKTSEKKSISEMSDEELQKENNRRQLENDLQRKKNDELDLENKRLELEKKYAELNPPKVSLGKKIYDKVWPTVEKATLNAGGKLLEEGLVSKGKELLGLKDDDFDFGKASKEFEFYEKYKKATGEEHPNVAKYTKKKKDKDDE